MQSTARRELPTRPLRYRGSTRQNLAFRDQTVMVVAFVASVWLLVAAWILQYPAAESSNDAHLCEAVFAGWTLLIAGWRFQRPLGGPSAFWLFVFGGLMAGAPFYVPYGWSASLHKALVNDVVFGTIIAVCGVFGMVVSALAARRARAAGKV
jgi:hypothetical protein